MKWVGLSAGIRFRAGDIQVDDDGLLAAADDDGLDGHIAPRIQFLMRNVGRHVNEISGARFIYKFQLVSPAKAGAPAHHIDHRLQFAVMMGTGLGIGMHHHGSGPQLLGAHAGVRYGFGARHAGSLRGVRV